MEPFWFENEPTRVVPLESRESTLILDLYSKRRRLNHLVQLQSAMTILFEFIVMSECTESSEHQEQKQEAGCVN